MVALAVDGAAVELGLTDVAGWIVQGHGPLLEGEGLAEDFVAQFVRQPKRLPASCQATAACWSFFGYPNTIPAGARFRTLFAERGWRSHGPLVDAVTSPRCGTEVELGCTVSRIR